MEGSNIIMKLIKNIKIVFKDSISEGAVLFSEFIEDIILGNTDKVHTNGDLLISEITKKNEENNKLQGSSEELEIINGEGAYLVPGFIDIHIHGSAGFDTMDSSREALDGISKSLISSGVTSFLPTTMTMPRNDVGSALRNIRDFMISNDKEYAGARVLGCHLEGPFLNQEFKGAQSSTDIIGPDIDLIKEYLDIIKIVTIAPEIEGAESFIRFLLEANNEKDAEVHAEKNIDVTEKKNNDVNKKKNIDVNVVKNIVVSAGHSGATYQEILNARDWGLTHVTHLFNAMCKFHHREPGIIGAVMTTDLSCELIVDFIHVHPAAIQMVLQAKDTDQIILVTDQMRAGLLGDGEYDLGGQKVIVNEGSARLENGQLAGSILTLDQAVRNVKSITDEVLDIPLYKIINMVTYNPAKRLGMENEIGHIEKGKRADFVLLNEELEVKAVYRDGNIILRE
ncbi:MAG: N-acetylglucosamine-6-phosphate deacetylase [Halanaerobiales bacterium]